MEITVELDRGYGDIERIFSKYAVILYENDGDIGLVRANEDIDISEYSPLMTSALLKCAFEENMRFCGKPVEGEQNENND